MDKGITLFAGMDIGDRMVELYVVDEHGELVEESRVSCTMSGLRRKFMSLARCRAALEVGAHSRWISRALQELGHEVLVADARRLRLIYKNPNKNDRADAEYLARLARLDPELLSPVQHRSEEAQADLAVLRSRDSLVRARTLLINHARGLVKSFGGRLPGCSAESFATKADNHISAPLRPALVPILETVATLTKKIHAYDQQVETLARRRYPEAMSLQRIHGVGPLTSLGYVLTLEDPRRFPKSRQVGAYLGMVPRRRQSSDHDPQLRINKCGDPYLRRLLVGSAQYILGPFGPECDLRRWGLALAERGGKNAKKRAVVAVARKLAVVLHRLWITGEEYEPVRARVAAAGPEQVAPPIQLGPTPAG